MFSKQAFVSIQSLISLLMLKTKQFAQLRHLYTESTVKHYIQKSLIVVVDDDPGGVTPFTHHFSGDLMRIVNPGQGFVSSWIQVQRLASVLVLGLTVHIHIRGGEV